MIEDMKKKLNVLLVENSPMDCKMLKEMLSKSAYGSFISQSTDSLKSALEMISQDGFDVVLLDLNLQDSKGLETLKKLREACPQLPIVVNTGAYEDDLGLRAVTQGAQDYLIKGKYKPYGLSKSLYYAVERKNAEENLHSAYQRQKDIQAQLIQAEKMNVIGGVASGVAHEVKNPLATIMYGIEFLCMKIDAKDEKIKLTLSSIKDAAQKANNIIKDLLDFASLSNLHCRPEDLNSIVEQSVNFVKYQCDNASIKVIRDYDEKLPRVDIDKNRVEQVLVDIMLNALHAMKRGGRLTVRTSTKTFSKKDRDLTCDEIAAEEGAVLVVVEIDDTGTGISKESLSKLFDPFYTTRRAGGGVGLGLSIAKTIMTNHEGCISLLNRPEGGARARLVFKASEKPAG